MRSWDEQTDRRRPSGLGAALARKGNAIPWRWQLGARRAALSGGVAGRLSQHRCSPAPRDRRCESWHIDRAIYYWDTLLSMEPHHLNALAAKGGLLHRTWRLSEALSCFEIAAGLAPDDALIRNNLAVALADSGERMKRSSTSATGFARLKPSTGYAQRLKLNLSNTKSSKALSAARIARWSHDPTRAAQVHDPLGGVRRGYPLTITRRKICEHQSLVQSSNLNPAMRWNSAVLLLTSGRPRAIA